MADDDRDFIERTDSVTEKLHGKTTSIDDTAENFALYGLKKRAAALENFDAELRGEIGSGSHSLRRQVKLMELRKKMGMAAQQRAREKFSANIVVPQYEALYRRVRQYRRRHRVGCEGRRQTAQPPFA